MLTKDLSGSLAAACAFAGIAVASPTGSDLVRRQGATFNNEVVFVPPSDYTSHKVLYARFAQLPDGSLILTWDNQSPEPPLVWTPVFRSTDGGYTWSNYTTVHDSQNGWGLRYQAFPFVLTEQIGHFPKEALLCLPSTPHPQIGLTLRLNSMPVPTMPGAPPLSLASPQQAGRPLTPPEVVTAYNFGSRS